MRALTLIVILIIAVSCGHPFDTSRIPPDTSCLRMTILDSTTEFSCVDTIKVRLRLTRCDSVPIRIPLIGPFFRLVRDAEAPVDSEYRGIPYFDDLPLAPIERPGQLPFQTIMPGDSIDATAEFLCTQRAVSKWSYPIRILYRVVIDYPKDQRRYSLLSSNSAIVTLCPWCK